MTFENKVCLITGAGSGIGRATAERFAANGASVVVIDKNEGGGKETVEIISRNNGKAVFCKADIAVESDIQVVVNYVIKTWERIDILVNNAAMMIYKKVVDLTAEEWDKVMEVNLRSVFLFCKYSIPHMQNGAIVNVSS